MYVLHAFLYCDNVAILWISTQSLIHPLHISYSNGFRWGNVFTATCQLYKSEYDFWHRRNGSALMHSSWSLWDFVCKWLKETLPSSGLLVWGCTAAHYSLHRLPTCGMYCPQLMRTTLSLAALVRSLISGLTGRYGQKHVRIVASVIFHCLPLSDVRFITSLKSNLCTTLTGHSCISALRILNWNPSVTGHWHLSDCPCIATVRVSAAVVSW
jgi:hypothetical protein